MSGNSWSTSEFKFLLECLAESKSVTEALTKFNQKYNRTMDSVRKKFTSENRGAISKYLGLANFDADKYHEIVKDENQKRLLEEVEMRELRELKKKQTVIDIILDRLSAEIIRLPKPTIIKPGAYKVKNARVIEDLVAPVSDVQIGEFVDPVDVAGLGTYSVDIFKRRVTIWKEYLIKVIEHRVSTNNLQKIHIPFIGDIVEGMDIFPSQAYHLDHGLVKQVVHGAFIFSEAIAEISNHFKNVIPIEIEHVGGNHGRIGRKGATPYKDNWDRVLGYFMKLHLEKYPNIHVEIPETWFTLKSIHGWNFHFSHGDDINSWMGIPAYGMLRAHSRESVMLSTPLHYYQIGHHHTMTTIQNGYGEVLCNGNWVGGNEFSSKIIKSSNRPCQLLYTVNAHYGIEDRFVVYFENRETYTGRITESLHKLGLK